MNHHNFYSTSLFVDPSLPVSREGKKRKRNSRLEEEELVAFGYELKIYNDKDLAKKVDQGKYLIPWKSYKSSSILMDRFDVRHLAQDENQLRVTQKSMLEKDYNTERFRDLFGEGALSYCGTYKKAAIPYDYDKGKRKEETAAKAIVSDLEKEIRKKYNVPESMAVPTTANQMELMEAISREISSAVNSNLLEIRIQVKNANNSLYSFLNKQDPLYQFYKHLGLKNSIKMAPKSLVEYSDSSDGSDSE